jgi:hypothetical protein
MFYYFHHPYPFPGNKKAAVPYRAVVLYFRFQNSIAVVKTPKQKEL